VSAQKHHGGLAIQWSTTSTVSARKHHGDLAIHHIHREVLEPPWRPGDPHDKQHEEA